MLSHLPALAFRPETVVIDAGNRPDPLARLLWQGADRTLLVSTAETAAIMNAYASIKLLNDPARSASIALLLNRSPGTPAADEAQRRLVQACRRFLGLPLRSVGALPEDSNVPQCAARGEAFVLRRQHARQAWECGKRRARWQTTCREGRQRHDAALQRKETKTQPLAPVHPIWKDKHLYSMRCQTSPVR